MKKHLALLFFAGVVSTLPLCAQLKLEPIREVRSRSLSVQSTNATAKTHAVLDLPFWDDFSSTPLSSTLNRNEDAGRPLQELWWNSEGVSVNAGSGLNPPTINVASLDGLNAEGNAYSEQLLVNGFGDVLMSRQIDLSTAKVEESKRASVFLSFYYQWGGKAETPDDKDFLRVEFLDSDSVWQPILSIFPKPNQTPDQFYDTIVRVNSATFFHSKFQFRFRNFGRLSGPYDVWNLDYIYLNVNRNINDVFAPEGALTNSITPLFGDYSSVPLTHFREAPFFSEPTFDAYNLRPPLASAIYNHSVDATFTNYNPNDTTEYTTTLVNNITIANFGSRERITTEIKTLPDPADPLQFSPDALRTDVKLTVTLFSQDEVEPEYTPYIPIKFSNNNTLSNTYTLHDYYAYDDGSAETSVVLLGAGSKAAVQFTYINTEPDFLMGFFVHFPTYGVTSSLTANFLVLSHNAKDEIPDQVLARLPNRTVQGNGRNGMSYIALGTPLPIAGTYYIGWETTSAGNVKIGFDLNNNPQDKIFENIDGVWSKALNLNGSVMIRPRFGLGDFVSVEKESPSISVYPNPSNGTFFINHDVIVTEIMNMRGQRIAYTTEKQHEKTLIQLSQSTAGLYVIRGTAGRQSFTKKIIVR